MSEWAGVGWRGLQTTLAAFADDEKLSDSARMHAMENTQGVRMSCSPPQGRPWRLAQKAWAAGLAAQCQARRAARLCCQRHSCGQALSPPRSVAVLLSALLLSALLRRRPRLELGGTEVEGAAEGEGEELEGGVQRAGHEDLRKQARQKWLVGL